MRTKTTIIAIFSALWCAVGAGADGLVKEPDSQQQDHAGYVSNRALIRRVYVEELHREPDVAGMATYLDCLTKGGKAEEWLRQNLRESPEGRHVRTMHRARRAQVIGAFAIFSILCAVAFLIRHKIKEISGRIQRRHPSHSAYLSCPVLISPFAVLFLFLYLYSNLQSGGIQGVILIFFATIAGLVLTRMPRWLVYGVAVLGMILLIHHFVFVDARKDDAFSDRNEAVEIGTKALLGCENPWSRVSILNLPITTGPSSMVLAIPAVYFTGQIMALSFLAWLVFLAFLLAGDIANRNNTFLTLCLMTLFPWMGFIHTWHWSLDELYYAVILSPLLWLALKRRKLLVAGCICGFMLFSRLSYAFAVLAVGFWWFMSERRRLRECMLLIAGGVLYSFFMLAMLYMIGGHDFLHANFFLNSGVCGLASHSNWFVHSITVALGVLPHGSVGSALIVSAILLLVSFGMRAIAHPFFHIGLGLLLAHVIGFSPSNANDYILVFVIPVMYGIAFSNADMDKHRPVAC